TETTARRRSARAIPPPAPRPCASRNCSSTLYGSDPGAPDRGTAPTTADLQESLPPARPLQIGSYREPERLAGGNPDRACIRQEGEPAELIIYHEAHEAHEGNISRAKRAKIRYLYDSFASFAFFP